MIWLQKFLLALGLTIVGIASIPILQIPVFDASAAEGDTTYLEFMKIILIYFGLWSVLGLFFLSEITYRLRPLNEVFCFFSSRRMLVAFRLVLISSWLCAYFLRNGNDLVFTLQFAAACFLPMYLYLRIGIRYRLFDNICDHS